MHRQNNHSLNFLKSKEYIKEWNKIKKKIADKKIYREINHYYYSSDS
jgi:hypothetical protein